MVRIPVGHGHAGVDGPQGSLELHGHGHVLGGEGERHRRNERSVRPRQSAVSEASLDQMLYVSSNALTPHRAPYLGHEAQALVHVVAGLVGGLGEVVAGEVVDVLVLVAVEGLAVLGADLPEGVGCLEERLDRQCKCSGGDGSAVQCRASSGSAPAEAETRTTPPCLPALTLTQ